MRLHDGSGGTHTHPCSQCGDQFECGGYWIRNYDGFPAAICSSYHEAEYDQCETCHDAERCGFCGIPLPTGGGKVLGGDAEGLACDDECRQVLEREHWTPAEAERAKEKLAAWQDAKAAERTRLHEADVARLRAKREADRALPDVECPF